MPAAATAPSVCSIRYINTCSAQSPKRKKKKEKSRELRQRIKEKKNKFKEGEKVSIIECKPISKKKTWQVIE